MAWYPQRTVCHAEMALSEARRRYDALHADGTGRRFHDGTFQLWSENRSAAFPFAHDDGVTVWVSPDDLTPDDDFLDDPRDGGD